MDRIPVILLLVAACSGPALAQQLLNEEAGNQEQKETIAWMSWEQAMSTSQTEARKILFYVHTSWCSWCKRMNNNTLQQPKVVDYINANFYPVWFDAEQQKQLEYKGETYEYVKNSKQGYHELAAKFLNGRMSYPSVVFIDEEMEVIQPIIGFRTPDEFMKILAYFSENHYLNIPWSTFNKQY